VNQLAARLSLVIALISSIAVAALGPAQRAAASHLPPPAEIVVKQGDLPPGLEPVEEAGAASLLPDGLARQAAASFRRDPAQESEPGVRYARQVVLAFDDREASEYVPRFRDLMVKHQGYGVVESGESQFKLTRTRAEEASIVVATAHGEVLVVTTVAGVAGTVGPDDAARLTQVAVARVPTVEQSAAAISTDPGARTLSNAQVGPGYLEIPNQQDAARWPQPVQNLPGPPAIDVVQARNSRAVGDPSLNELIPVPQRARPAAHGSSELVVFARTLGPLLNEFWQRALAMTDVDMAVARLRHCSVRGPRVGPPHPEVDGTHSLERRAHLQQPGQLAAHHTPEGAPGRLLRRAVHAICSRSWLDTVRRPERSTRGHAAGG